MSLRPPLPTLFPYTTLFRSRSVPAGEVPAMRIEATADMPWILRANCGGSEGGICHSSTPLFVRGMSTNRVVAAGVRLAVHAVHRSEEHTSELQSPYDLVCRL